MMNASDPLAVCFAALRGRALRPARLPARAKLFVLAAPFVVLGTVAAQPVQVAPPPLYLQIIVTACPTIETKIVPQNQGHIIDNDPDPEPDPAHPIANHLKLMKSLGCIDVPIPSQFVQGVNQLNCVGHAGEQASEEFVEQRADLKGMSAYGYQCILQSHPATGIVGG